MVNRLDQGMGEDRLEFRVYAVSASGDALGTSRLKAGLQMARSRGFIRSATVSETSRAPAVRFRKRLSFNTQQSTFINRNSTLRRL